MQRLLHNYKRHNMQPALINNEYQQWIADLKQRIHRSQIKASLKVNAEMLQLYWKLGKDIAERKIDAAWGSGFYRTLSHDLKQEFPDIKGFSETNLKYIKRFYLFYSQSDIIRQQVADELPEYMVSIPWFHHVYIFTKCSSVDEAFFYINRTIEHGWSRAVLEHQVDLNLYQRDSKAVSNFTKTLPAPLSDLAQQVTKDPYTFDFLAVRDRYDEKELQKHLTQNMTKFLLELGAGFSFYGQEVHLNVAGDDFYIDLLFYHTKLHCYVVVELKTVKFKPEHIGQLKFYVTAVDNQLKAEMDNPTIGLLICKDKNDVVAGYTLSDIDSPIGISSYEIYNKLSANFKSSLPTIEEIEKELSDKE